MSDNWTPISLSETQLQQLRRDLKIASEPVLNSVVRRIEGAASYFRLRVEQRNRTPDVQTARTEMVNVRTHAESLLAAIDLSAPALYLLDFDGADREPENKEELHRLLSGIARRARAVIQDETALRALYGLPEATSANQSIKTQYLWPTLFSIYFDVTGGLSYSPGGPLERYLGIAHEAIGLEQPSSATLRIAASQWRLDNTCR